MTLRQLIQLARSRHSITDDLTKDLDSIVAIRNKAVHESEEPTKRQAQYVLDTVQKTINALPEDLVIEDEDDLLSYTGKENLSKDQKRILGHLYFEQAQSLERLSSYLDLPMERMEELIGQLAPIVERRDDGLLWARVIDKSWARELALQASRERFGRG
jgi:hypothetical protein